MEKLLIFIISGPLFLSLMLLGPKQGFEVRHSTTDTIPQKTDTSKAKTCLDCHAVLVEKQFKHVTKTEKGCADCHTSGDKDHPKTAIALEKKLPELCFTCHEDKKKLIATAPFVHSVVNDKKACTNCHSPHSGDTKELLITNRKELCLSCHNKSITTKTKTISNIAQLEKNSKVLHKPFKKCSSSCHNPHASANYKLLNSPFTASTYLPVSNDSFALCWVCHESEVIGNAKTSSATSFRNGDTNLHYTHVHGEKGRSCLVCHSPHATNNLHLIRDKVAFGSWEFRMNYLSNENGGSCAPGCHAERKYTR